MRREEREKGKERKGERRLTVLCAVSFKEDPSISLLCLRLRLS
ncbi:uncharacterized protein G2W53_030614 [Senna tora]|uniref:Uncharacterized protein n=1 Tax=Senna tora TaxID=362788 RepID=A0A834T7S0_9FABA|nr:uncharacterized protein G2W53_030614 [Senna tora]